MNRTTQQDGMTVTLDLSSQILRLDIPEEFDMAGEEGSVEAPIYPTLNDVPGRQGFVSASVLAAKAKQFDDGLYAAVEMLCQNGGGDFPGKRRLLRSVAEALESPAMEQDADRKAIEDCRALLHAASVLGGRDLAVDPPVEKQSEEIRREFLGDEMRAKSIGFYTWTRELSQIFQQDRLLQQEFDNAAATRVMAQGLSEAEGALAAYQTYRNLVQKLTNPLPPEFRHLADVSDIEREGLKFCFFPPSQAHETQLIKRLYGNTPIPEGFSLVDEMIERIRAGKLDLAPTDASGWYDYQVHAIEPFVIPETTPEAGKLRFDEGYRKELADLFKGILALSRETHIKQLEIPAVGAGVMPDEEPRVEVHIYPDLSVEPTVTFFLRRAIAYRFVRDLLVSTFGEEALAGARRLTASGEVGKSLLEGLRDTEGLFYGAYLIAAREIGLAVESQVDVGSGRGADADRELAGRWFDSCTQDPDVGADNRMMVPVFYDILRKKTKAWVVLGYSVKHLSVWFERRPGVTVADERGAPVKAKPIFHGQSAPLAYPVSAELYVDKILNRDEFRGLCDKHKTQSAILDALGEL